MARRGELPVSAYVVLGLVAKYENITAYGLKKTISEVIGNFWKIGHPQVYAVTKRLREEGYIAEHLEETGRRRRSFRLTRKGRDEFDGWMADTDGFYSEFRDVGTLKLFFADGLDDETMLAFAEGQERAHRARLAEFEEIARIYPPRGYQVKTIEMGRVAENATIDFWTAFSEELRIRIEDSAERDAG